ncbi:uncharacterized protein LOC129592303 isoform X2 [Paramacrobiotus metropolitanus]|nr:uncharacterized protein LOC129592303 isoform X2 [Paramacrobiotus metropolitanus]
MEVMEGEPQRQRQPVTAKQKEQIVRLWRNSAYTNAQIAQQCRVKITTMYKILRTAPSISARRKSNPWRKSCRAERRKKIVDLFEKGSTVSDIMQEAQVNEKSINAALRRAGMSFKERDNPGLSQQQKAAILKLFEEGHMGTDIQEKVSVSKNALQKFLRETGKSFKKRDSAARTGIYETVSNEMMAQIAELQADGVRPAEIAKRLGVSRQSVIRVTAQSCGAPLCDRMLRSAQSQDGEDGRSVKPRDTQLPISDPHHSERGPYGHPGLAERKSISSAQDSRNTDERQNARRPRGRPRGTTSAVGYKVSGGRHKNKSANNGPSNAAVAVNVTSDVVELAAAKQPQGLLKQIPMYMRRIHSLPSNYSVESATFPRKKSCIAPKHPLESSRSSNRK